MVYFSVVSQKRGDKNSSYRTQIYSKICVKLTKVKENLKFKKEKFKQKYRCNKNTTSILSLEL